jgi:hypothetical protein
MTMKAPNWNCDGGHCIDPKGEVKVYPLGGGANLNLCHACWAHENRYRFNRGKENKRPQDWPQQDWAIAKRYGEG